MKINDILSFLVFSSVVLIVRVYCQTIQPSNGDITLNQGTNTTQGVLQVFYNGEFRSVCLLGFNQNAADTACTQLGYERAENYTAFDTSEEGSGSLTPLPPALYNLSCDSVQLHVLRCSYSIGPVTSCDHMNDVYLTCGRVRTPYIGEVRLYNGPYKSGGLLQVYLNGRWGTVCIEYFSTGIGDVVCRQLGYTSAVRVRRYPWVDNQRFVWLRELGCNTTDLNCFKSCYTPPTIRNIFCGNVDDVELTCTFDESLISIGSGSRTACEIEIKTVHTGVIIVLIVIFSGVFLTYTIFFIGRFITAAWHKTDRYKMKEPERKHHFTDYHKALSDNSLQLSEPYDRDQTVAAGGIQEIPAIVEN